MLLAWFCPSTNFRVHNKSSLSVPTALPSSSCHLLLLRIWSDVLLFALVFVSCTIDRHILSMPLITPWRKICACFAHTGFFLGFPGRLVDICVCKMFMTLTIKQNMCSWVSCTCLHSPTVFGLDKGSHAHVVHKPHRTSAYTYTSTHHKQHTHNKGPMTFFDNFSKRKRNRKHAKIHSLRSQKKDDENQPNFVAVVCCACCCCRPGLLSCLQSKPAVQLPR